MERSRVSKVSKGGESVMSFTTLAIQQIITTFTAKIIKTMMIGLTKIITKIYALNVIWGRLKTPTP